MNGKNSKKELPRCPDCDFLLQPQPTEYRDGCLIKALYCPVCECEKDILSVQVIERRPDDLRKGQEARR